MSSSELSPVKDALNKTAIVGALHIWFAQCPDLADSALR
jgi:hypothetical protein